MNTINAWTSSDAPIGNPISFDTETTLIEAGKISVPVFGVAASASHATVFIDRQHLKRFLIDHAGAIIFMHNAAFDLSVVFGKECVSSALLSLPNIIDTGVLYRLLELAVSGCVGRWSLAHAAEKHLGIKIDKDDALRLGAAPFLGRPLTDIPLPLLKYGAKDAETTLALGNVLLAKVRALAGDGLLTHSTQLHASLALLAAGLNGIEIRADAVKALRCRLDRQLDELANTLRHLGISMKLPGVQKALRTEACRAAIAAGVSLRTVEKSEGVSLAEDNLRNLAPHSAAIAAYLNYRDVEKRLSLLPPEGLRRLYPSFNLLVDTGRTSCSGPNLQQVPKSQEVRSLFAAREGALLFVADFKFIELCSLAQVCLARYGESRMADLINRGTDLHTAFAAKIFDKKPNEVSKPERQHAKAANFGFPGGLGANAFVEFARTSYGVELSLLDCERLRTSWLDTFPEMRRYLRDPREDHVVIRTNPFDMSPSVALATVRKVARGGRESTGGKPYSAWLLTWVQHVAMPALCTPGQPFDPTFDYGAALAIETVSTTTGRIRANCRYTQARNTPFQGLAADGAKLALFELLHAGFCIVGFVHDEILCEILDDAEAQEKARKAARLMVAGMAEVHPNVRVGVEWILTRDWAKREILASGETFSQEALA